MCKYVTIKGKRNDSSTFQEIGRTHKREDFTAAQEESQKDCNSLIFRKPENFFKSVFMICRTSYVSLPEVSDYYMDCQQIQVFILVKRLY